MVNIMPHHVITARMAGTCMKTKIILVIICHSKLTFHYMYLGKKEIWSNLMKLQIYELIKQHQWYTCSKSVVHTVATVEAA